eukprot:7326372-Lingulodinium_polyedra.AAC.1
MTAAWQAALQAPPHPRRRTPRFGTLDATRPAHCVGWGRRGLNTCFIGARRSRRHGYSAEARDP